MSYEKFLTAIFLLLYKRLTLTNDKLQQTFKYKNSTIKFYDKKYEYSTCSLKKIKKMNILPLVWKDEYSTCSLKRIKKMNILPVVWKDEYSTCSLKR